MNQRTALSERVDYGIDTPRDLRRNLLYGITGVVLGSLLLYLAQGGLFGVFLGGISLVSGILLLVISAVMFWGSKVGKLRLRDQVIDALPWRGDEHVLDIGCGHGLLLIGAAKHLTTGQAMGVDIWIDTEQTANSPDATLKNAALEGVAGRVAVRNGDARDLPFDNNSFEVVLSSWVIHTLLDPEDRTQALDEITRVLKPGGRLVIIDIERVNEYAQYFRSKDWIDVTKSKPNFLFANPTYILTATKPH